MGPVIPHLKVYNFQFSAEQRWAVIPLSFGFSILAESFGPRTLISAWHLTGAAPNKNS